MQILQHLEIARIGSSAEDLNLSSSQFLWLPTSLYCTYIAFQWVTLLYHTKPAHIYIPIPLRAVVECNSISPSHTGSFISTLVIRNLVGIGEAAFSTGVSSLLSFVFKRDELTFRTGLFMPAAPRAASFASSLAWLIMNTGPHILIAAWRLPLSFEDFPSIIATIFAWYEITDTPYTAWHLRPGKNEVARLTLKPDASSRILTNEKSKSDWREIRKALRYLICWITAVI